MGRSGAATLRIRMTALVKVHVAACYGFVFIFYFRFSNFGTYGCRARGLALLQVEVQEAFGVGVGYAIFVGWAYW
jgi:hypothetical protein